MMPSLETLPPPPGDPSGGVFYLQIFCLQRKHLTHEYFVTIFFHGEELLEPHPTPKLEDHPLSAVHDCLFNLFTVTLHIRGRSSIRNLKTRHAVVTGTHKHGFNLHMQHKILTCDYDHKYMSYTLCNFFSPLQLTSSLKWRMSRHLQLYY